MLIIHVRRVIRIHSAVLFASATTLLGKKKKYLTTTLPWQVDFRRNAPAERVPAGGVFNPPPPDDHMETGVWKRHAFSPHAGAPSWAVQ